MKLFLKILPVILIVSTILLLVPVLREWNYDFDAHGKHISPDGTVHWESDNEKNFFFLLLSFLLLCGSLIVYFRKTKSNN